MARDTILARNIWKGSAVAGCLDVSYPYYNWNKSKIYTLWKNFLPDSELPKEFT